CAHARACRARRCDPTRRRRLPLPGLLRPVRVEVVDAAARGLGRQADDVVVVAAASLYPLPAHVRGHVAADLAARTASAGVRSQPLLATRERVMSMLAI